MSMSRKSEKFQYEPQPTNHIGLQFRSRREARWAIFFDFLGITYKYEPQYFKFGKDRDDYYLPDFYLPDYYLWFEVKGRKPDNRENRVARLLARHTGCSVAIYHAFPEAVKFGKSVSVLYQPGNGNRFEVEKKYNFVWYEHLLTGAFRFMSLGLENLPDWKTDSTRLKYAYQAAAEHSFVNYGEGRINSV